MMCVCTYVYNCTRTYVHILNIQGFQIEISMVRSHDFCIDFRKLFLNSPPAQDESSISAPVSVGTWAGVMAGLHKDGFMVL